MEFWNDFWRSANAHIEREGNEFGREAAEVLYHRYRDQWRDLCARPAPKAEPAEVALLRDSFHPHPMIRNLYVARPGSIFEASARMYGIDLGTDTPTPEKSPADRALDKITEAEREFIEKRKAKREAKGLYDETSAQDAADLLRRIKDIKNGEALDRGLSKSFIHHTNFTERLSPYRGWSLPVNSNG